MRPRDRRLRPPVPSPSCVFLWRRLNGPMRPMVIGLEGQGCSRLGRSAARVASGGVPSRISHPDSPSHWPSRQGGPQRGGLPAELRCFFFELGRVLFEFGHVLFELGFRPASAHLGHELLAALRDRSEISGWQRRARSRARQRASARHFQRSDDQTSPADGAPRCLVAVARGRFARATGIGSSRPRVELRAVPRPKPLEAAGVVQQVGDRRRERLTGTEGTAPASSSRPTAKRLVPSATGT